MRTLWRSKQKFLFFFFLFVLFPSLVSAVEFSLTWSAGLKQASFSLVNQNLASWVERTNKEASIQNWVIERTSVPILKYGYELAVGLQVDLNSRWSFGLESGLLYFELTEEETTLSIKKENIIFYYAHPTKATAIPIGLNLTYSFPLIKKINFYITGETGFLFARYIDREASRKQTDLKFVYPVYQNASAISPFFLLGIGFYFQLESTTSLFLEINYKQARVTSFKGTNKAGQQGPLEFYEEYLPSLDFWQARLLIMTAEPDPEISRNRRKSVIDFSGFSIKIGMKIKF